MILEIHHVNVGHGDATVIAVMNDLDDCVYKVLIDASTETGVDALLEYFVDNFRDSSFDVVIASHYHEDHLKGLALGLGTLIKTKFILDIGGYNLTPIEPSPGTAVPDANPPQNPPHPAPPPESKELLDLYLEGVKYSALPERDHPLRRATFSLPEALGVPLPLTTIQGVPLMLTCVAGNGFVVQNPNRKTGASGNANNYGLAFILDYGAFRYFTGGDLGGSAGSYVDHESLLAPALAQADKAHAGHICAFKANHHGSKNSNNNTFLKTLRPTVCITSVGTHGGHKLPNVSFLQELDQSTSPSQRQGFFFTNLKDYGPGANSFTTANNLFGLRPHTTFNTGPASYILQVEPHAKRTTESKFKVFAGNRPSQRQLLASFDCH